MEADFNSIIRSVMDACADCETCRFLMNEGCLFFPELYRLGDRQKENGQPASEHELESVVELCTLCGLCPCPNIRNDIIRAKTALVRKDGMAIGCTAGYLFPEVGRAAVMTLEQNDVNVFVPSQQCCGMPTLVKGDIRTTFRRVKSNIDNSKSPWLTTC